MTGKRLLRIGIGIAVVGAVAYFFTRALRDNWDNLQDADLSLGWWALWAIVLFIAAVGVSGWLWGRIVGQLEATPLGHTEGVRVHFGSWLLKYIPGQAGFVVNKVLWGKKRGTSRLLVLISVVYENAFLLLSSTVPMFAILVIANANRDEMPSTTWLVIAAAIPLVVLAHPAIFRRALNLLAKRTLKRPVPSQYFLSGWSTLRFQAAFLIPRVINGIGVVFIAVALTDAPAQTWLPLIAAYALAGVIGIMAVFVPSGLGVRESAFVLFATPFLGLEQAIIVSLAARVLATIADIGIAAIYGGLTAAKKKKEQSP